MNTTKDEDLAKKLDRLRHDLAAQASKTRRGNWLTMLVGLLAMGALGGYFYFGYSQFAEVVQHERVADTVATILEDNLPSIRKSLEEETRKSAPVWAEGLSKQLRDSLPTGRKKLEDYVIAQTKETLEKGTVLTQEQFTRFIQNNKAALQADISELSKGPVFADAAIAELEKSLQTQLDGDLKTSANELVYILTAFIDKLTKLAKNQKLDQTESIERRLAMIARRVQSERISTAEPLGGSALPSAPATTSSPPAPSRGSEPRGIEGQKGQK
jgi:hypothetical protein